MPEKHLAVRVLNRRLERWFDARLVKVERPRGPVRGPVVATDRLAPAPVFLLSSVRSGSTLLRAVLDAHPEVHAPVETHFRRLTVTATKDPARQAMDSLGLNERDLEHLLWDRLLHRELAASGKSVIVEKTPSNVFVADRLRTAWPQARFLYLLRHPVSIAESWHEAEPGRRPMPRAIEHTLQYMQHLERARSRHPGLTVRYEDLVTTPDSVVREVCRFLGVDYHEAMLEYGRNGSDAFAQGIGDWRGKIRSGTIQPGRPLPAAEAIPPELAPMCTTWGYA